MPISDGMREVVVSVREARRFDPHVISMLVIALADNRDSIISEWLSGLEHKTVIDVLLAQNCLVATKIGGEIVGVISKAEYGCENPECISVPQQFSVRSLYIPAQHKGVGRMLLTAVEKTAKESGLDEVHTHIHQGHPPFVEKFFVNNNWVKKNTNLYTKLLNH